MSFRDLVSGGKNGNDATIRMSDGAKPPVITTPGTVLSDTLYLERETINLHANAAGDVRLMLHDGSIATYTLAAGMDYAYRAKRIYSTGTTLTAAQIVLCYSDS